MSDQVQYGGQRAVEANGPLRKQGHIERISHSLGAKLETVASFANRLEHVSLRISGSVPEPVPTPNIPRPSDVKGPLLGEIEQTLNALDYQLERLAVYVKQMENL